MERAQAAASGSRQRRRRLGSHRHPRARGHQPREARQAAGRCSPATARHRDGRQLQPTHRRRGGRPADERGEGRRARRHRPGRASPRWSYVGVDPADQLLIGPGPGHAARPRPSWPARSPTSISSTCTRPSPPRCCAVLKALGQRQLRARAPGARWRRRRWSIRRASTCMVARSPSDTRSAATGARMVTTMAHELHDTGKATALLGICAQGGLGAAALLENAGIG